MEWSDVIAVVQNVEEPTFQTPARAATTAVSEEVPVEFSEVGHEPALTGGGGESVEADPFAQRLG